MLPLDRQNEYRRRYRALVPGWRSSGEVYEQSVRHSLSSSARVLDVGGGRGGLVELVHADVALAAALDPDLSSLRQHRAAARISRAAGLAEALPFGDGCFDLVVASWLLEHLAWPERAFAEVRRVLRSPEPAGGQPGGQFIFLTPNALHPLLIANRLGQLLPGLQRRLVPRLYGRGQADTFPLRYRANTPARLRSLCARTGFNLALYPVADPTYTAFGETLFRLSVWAERAVPQPLKIHLLGVAVKQ